VTDSLRDKFRAFVEVDQLDRQCSSADSEMRSKVLELGAGKDRFSDDPVRLDVHDYPGTDVVFDLESLGDGEQLPFADNSFDKVRAKQVLEHIEHVEAVFEEVYRVLKDGGSFVVEVPHAESPNAFSEMGATGHCQFFNEKALLHFGENDWGIQNERMDCEFQVEKVRTFYNWEIQRMPNPVKFWKPESIEAVYVKSDEDVSTWLCDSFFKSLFFRVMRK